MMSDDVVRGKDLNVILVDDEKHCRDALARMLTLHFPAIRILAHCDSTDAAAKTIAALNPELVFLDIMLPDGTAFDLLQRFDPVPFRIIFTTAHDEYAIRAIRFSALDYLMKPLLLEELRTAVDRAIRMMPMRESYSSQIRLLHDRIGGIHGGQEKIALPTLDGFQFVELADIVSCEARSNYTECTLANAESLLVCRTLKEFEELLVQHGFFRIHHSHIINLHHLKRYVRGKGGYVIMSNNREFEVSTRRKEDFLAHLCQ